MECARRQGAGHGPTHRTRAQGGSRTRFVDELSDATAVDPSLGGDFPSFGSTARSFAPEHAGDVAIAELRSRRPLTAADTGELERMFLGAGVGADVDVTRARATEVARACGSGVLLRQGAGRDLAALQFHLADLIADLIADGASADRIEFVDMGVDHFTTGGVIDRGRPRESPFSDRSPGGPDGGIAGARGCSPVARASRGQQGGGGKDRIVIRRSSIGAVGRWPFGGMPECSGRHGEGRPPCHAGWKIRQSTPVTAVAARNLLRFCPDPAGRPHADAMRYGRPPVAVRESRPGRLRTAPRPQPARGRMSLRPATSIRTWRSPSRNTARKMIPPWRRGWR